MFFSPPYFSLSCVLTDKILFLISLLQTVPFISQVTAVHLVGEGQCIALGYESALPLVLLTLQGGDIKPFEFPTEGTKAMAGTGMFLLRLVLPEDTDVFRDGLSLRHCKARITQFLPASCFFFAFLPIIFVKYPFKMRPKSLQKSHLTLCR